MGRDVLILTAVVSIQALIFQDGGILALGANIFNMAVVGVTVSYFTYRTVQRLAPWQKWGIFAGGFAAGWLSIFIAALAVALQLALSGTSPANLAVPAMGGIHALIGVGEGLITVGALAFLYTARRDLVVQGSEGVGRGKAVWLGGLIVAHRPGRAGAARLVASRRPGVGRGAARVPGPGKGVVVRHPSGLRVARRVEPAVATILAGVIGVLLVLGCRARPGLRAPAPGTAEQQA